MTDDKKLQLDKFKEAARDLECDDDDQRFKERLEKVAKQKPESKLGERAQRTLAAQIGND